MDLPELNLYCIMKAISVSNKSALIQVILRSVTVVWRFMVACDILFHLSPCLF